jgi:hypothetical protein
LNTADTTKLGVFPPSSQPLLTCIQKDFPNVRYWRKSEWKKRDKAAKSETAMNEKAPERGGTRAADGPGEARNKIIIHYFILNYVVLYQYSTGMDAIRR